MRHPVLDSLKHSINQRVPAAWLFSSPYRAKKVDQLVESVLMDRWADTWTEINLPTSWITPTCITNHKIYKSQVCNSLVMIATKPLVFVLRNEYL